MVGKKNHISKGKTDKHCCLLGKKQSYQIKQKQNSISASQM